MASTPLAPHTAIRRKLERGAALDRLPSIFASFPGIAWVGAFFRAVYPNLAAVAMLTGVDQLWIADDHPYWLRNSEKAKDSGHSGGDFFTLQHFYRCVRENKTPGIDVYDAVTWSVFTPLSAASIRQGSSPQQVPDYTSGKWKTRKRFDWALHG